MGCGASTPLQPFNIVVTTTGPATVVVSVAPSASAPTITYSYPNAPQVTSQAPQAGPQPTQLPSVPKSIAPLLDEIDITPDGEGSLPDPFVVVRGITITASDARKFCPWVVAYSTEKYSPCSIESLLSGSEWFRVPNDSRGEPDWTKPGENVTPAGGPTVDALSRLENNGRNVMVHIKESQWTGSGWSAPMYVNPQVPASLDYIDLTYFFLFAYNGPQSIQMGVFGINTKIVLPNYACHEGDIESITVRISRDKSTVLMVRYEAHGDSTVYPVSQVTFRESTRPVVGLALNSHSTYNPTGHSGQYTVIEQSMSFNVYNVDFGDFISADVGSSPSWAPNEFIFVGLTDSGSPLSGTAPWARFSGRLGKRQINGVTNPWYIHGDDGPLSNFTQLLVWSMASIAESLHRIPEDKKIGIGPGALGTRGINVNSPRDLHPTTRVVVRSLRAPYLALSINPADPNGVLQMWPYRANDNNMLWDKGDFPAINEFCLQNARTQRYMWTRGEGQLVSQSVARNENNSLWQWLPGSHVIRAGVNLRTMNLNVVSSNNTVVPYANVCNWEWGGGKENELWTIDLATNLVFPLSHRQVLFRLATRPIYMYADAPEVGIPNEAKAGFYNHDHPTYFVFDWDDYGAGFSLNVFGGALTAPSNNSHTVMRTPGSTGSAGLWDYFAAARAMRPKRDTNMNLRFVTGNISSLNVSDWSGSPFQTWVFAEPSTAPPKGKSVRIACFSEPRLFLIANPDNLRNDVILRLDSPLDLKWQTWIMGNVENGYCTLQSVATGFYLTAGENAGNMVQVKPGESYNDNMLWKVITLETKIFLTKYTNNSLNLVIPSPDGSPRAGVPAVMQTSQGGKPNEQWRVEEYPPPHVSSDQSFVAQ